MRPLIIVLLLNCAIFGWCQNNCFVRTCSQIIIGRNLRYPRALQIIQDEEYLDEADFDLLRRRYHKDKIRRQTTPCSTDPNDPCFYTPAVATPVINEIIDIPQELNDPESDLITPVFVGAGVIGGALLAAFPNYPLVNNELVPPGNPLPGTPGGGGLPSTGSPALLALVPLGLTPVAVFPPFATPRTFPAEAVIFSEVPQIQGAPTVGLRKKRSLRDWFSSFTAQNRQYTSRKSFLDVILGIMDTIRYKFKQLSRNGRCLRTRLYAKSHPDDINELRRISRQYPTFEKSPNDDTINSIDDCIEGIEEPLYGFIVNVTLVENQQCILEETCEGQIDANVDFFEERQSGEEFSSFAPPDCRIVFDPVASGCLG